MSRLRRGGAGGRGAVVGAAVAGVVLGVVALDVVGGSAVVVVDAAGVVDGAVVATRFVVDVEPTVDDVAIVTTDFLFDGLLAPAIPATRSTAMTGTAIFTQSGAALQ